MKVKLKQNPVIMYLILPWPIFLIYIILYAGSSAVLILNEGIVLHTRVMMILLLLHIIITKGS